MSLINILVFDMGGGTLDVAYIQRTERGFEVPVKPKGFEECSGKVFDRLLYDYLSKRCTEEYGFPFDTQVNEINLFALRECRKTRENLSMNDTARFRLFFGDSNKNVRLEISRKEYENLIRGPVAKAMDLVRNMVDELKEEDLLIDTILLIGGVSRTPLIIQEMKRLHEEEHLFPVLPLETMIKDIAVGLGAVADPDLLGQSKNDAEGQFQLGLSYFQGKDSPQDYEKAVECFRKAADQGNADTQDMLGDCYYKGRGVTQNYNEAVKWFKLAADQGDIHAQIKLLSVRI